MRPAEQIQRYLDEHGPSLQVPFHNLLTTWRLADAEGSERMRMQTELEAVGIAVSPGLMLLRPQDQVRLTIGSPPPGPPPWSPGASEDATDPPRHRRRTFGVIAAVAVALTVAGAIGGYVRGRDSGQDLRLARASGVGVGEREAARREDPRGVRRARVSGEHEGYREAYQPAFDQAKGAVLAAAPKSCGDARTNETPVLAKVRAEGVDCPTALSFVRSCQDVDAGCEGYSCEAVETGWEASEVTCTSGGRRIRFITAV